MNYKILYIILITLLALLLNVGGATAQQPEGDAPPEPPDLQQAEGQPQTGNITIQADVNSKISYQGVLKENGSPVNDNRDMVFELHYNDSNCTSADQTIAKNAVQVNEGVFGVELAVNQELFAGQGMYLRVKVAGVTIINCQEILTVPYALSLKPGARVVGFQPYWNAIYAQNTSSSGIGVHGVGYFGISGTSNYSGGRGVSGMANATSGANYGVYGSSSSNSGRGVYGLAAATSGTTYGVYGRSQSSSGRGVYGEATAGIGETYGVYGKSSSSVGTGVYGETTSNQGAGVVARNSFFIGTNNSIIEGWDKNDLRFKVTSGGHVYADGNYYGAGGVFNGGADLAERIIASEILEAGDVVEIDPANPGQFRKATTPYSTLAAGVVSTDPAIALANNLDPVTESFDDERPLLALVGRVPMKVSTENGAIQVGDLLTISATPGHAMRCDQPADCVGAVVGKALESLDSGTGVIETLVTLQ